MLDLNLYSKCCFLSAFVQDVSLLRGYEAEQGNSFTCKPNLLSLSKFCVSFSSRVDVCRVLTDLARDG